MTGVSSRTQRTLKRDAAVAGVSFLSGVDSRVTFRPAEADTGVVFVRTDLPGEPRVPARADCVVPRQRRTAIQQGEAVVEMVEHVLAALAGLQVDNCVVEIDAPETPGCDGSSRAFVDAILEAGIVPQDRKRPTLRIRHPVTVQEGSATLTAHPGVGESLVLSYNLDYGRDNPIGSQSLFLGLSPETFQNELASSRTFVLQSEAQALRESGIGAGVTEADLLVIGPNGPIDNTLRFPDECVRHKMLDMVGDLALAGRDIVGHVVAHRSGHQLNVALVRKLLEQVERDVMKPLALAESGPEPDLPLDIPAIMRLLPHRHPFLLIDRVTELEPEKRVVALKNVSYNEPFFPGHWPNQPVMPGVLILEALAQAAGILITRKFDLATQVAMIASIDGVRLRRPIVPGDQIRLEVDDFRCKRNFVDVHAKATVEGQLSAEAKFRFAVVPRPEREIL